MKEQKGKYFLISKLVEPLRWRYELYFAEKFDLYGSLLFFLKQKLQRRRKIKSSPVVYVYANKRNVGDYISHLGLKEIVGVDGPSLFCSPVWLAEFKEYIKILQRHNHDALLVIGGGGLLQPVFEPFWEVVLSSGLRFSAHGIGVNRMTGRGELNKSLFEKIGKNAEHLGVRDLYTKEMFEKNGMKTSTLTACPSINYLYPRYWKKAASSKSVLLHLIHPSDVRLAGANLLTISENLKKIAFDLGLQYQEHTNMDSSHVRMLNRVRQSTVIVSSRLHGCIMGYGMGIPFLPLLCDEKISEFLNTHTNVKGIAVKRAENIALLKERVNLLLTSQNDYSNQLKVKLKENERVGSHLSGLASHSGKN
jgi:hypothetical protein